MFRTEDLSDPSFGLLLWSRRSLSHVLSSGTQSRLADSLPYFLEPVRVVSKAALPVVRGCTGILGLERSVDARWTSSGVRRQDAHHERWGATYGTRASARLSRLLDLAGPPRGV